MARAVFKDKDLGWNNIEKELKTFRGATILVGFQEGEVTKVERKGQRTKDGGLSMPEIAAQNEFGTKISPARPFMSTSFDENRSKIVKLINQQYTKVQEGKIPADQSLIGIGVIMVGLIQRKIRQIISPPNSPTTIEIKGSSKPLIDFGQMIQSVTQKVVKR